MKYPMQHKIKKPKEYHSSVATDIRVTLKLHTPLHQSRAPKVVLAYPIGVGK